MTIVAKKLNHRQKKDKALIKDAIDKLPKKVKENYWVKGYLKSLDKNK